MQRNHLNSNQPTKTTPSFPDWSSRQVALATVFVVAVGLAFWLLIRFWLIFFILFIAIVISTAIAPAVDRLHRLGLPRSVGVILIYILVLGVAIGFILLVAPLVLEQVAGISEQIPEYYDSFRGMLIRSPSLLVRRLGLQLPRELVLIPGGAAPVQPAPPPVVQGEDPGEVTPEVVEQISLLFTYIGVVGRSIFISLGVFLLAFYWTLDGERTVRALLLLLPQKNRDGVRDIYNEIQDRLGRYIRGLALLSLLIGGASLVAYLLIGLPYAFSLALMAGIFEVVPVIGPWLGAIPAILVAASQGTTAQLVAIIAASILIQTLENVFFSPRVMDKSVGVNPILTLLSLATFTSLLGIPGALLAVPIAAVFQLLINRFLLTPAASEDSVPEGRDSLSALRLEVKELVGDVRKQIRTKEDGIPDEGDHLEDSIEEVAGELDRILAEARQPGEPEGRRAV